MPARKCLKTTLFYALQSQFVLKKSLSVSGEVAGKQTIQRQKWIFVKKFASSFNICSWANQFLFDFDEYSALER